MKVATRKSRKKELPIGWFQGGSRQDDYEIGLESELCHSGTRCVYLRDAVPKPQGFTTLMQTVTPEKFSGKRIRMRGWLKTKDLDGWCSFWMRVDGQRGGAEKPLAFDNMQDRPISGTCSWQSHDIVLDVPAEARSILFGVMFSGKGTAWIDDISFAEVTHDVAVTDMYANQKWSEPRNLDFEQIA